MVILQMLFSCLVAMAATFGFAILFRAPKTEYLPCAITGGVAYLAYSLAMRLGALAPMASFIATFVLMLMSRTLSALRKMPTFVYLLAGIFPLVPGSGIYFTAYYMFEGDAVLAAAKAVETLKLSGAIVLGILFGYALPQKAFNRLAR